MIETRIEEEEEKIKKKKKCCIIASRRRTTQQMTMLSCRKVLQRPACVSPRVTWGSQPQPTLHVPPSPGHHYYLEHVATRTQYGRTILDAHDACGCTCRLLPSVHTLVVDVPCCSEYPHANAMFGGELDDAGITGKVSVVEPNSGCTETFPTDNLNGSIAVIPRGVCSFGQKVFYAQMRLHICCYNIQQ